MYEYSYFVFDSIVSHVHIEKEKKTIQIKKKFYDWKESYLTKYYHIILSNYKTRFVQGLIFNTELH